MLKEQELFEFEMPHKGIKLLLKKFNPAELDEFAAEYSAKGTAWNFLQDKMASIQKEADGLEDFTGYSKRLSSILKESHLMALEMYSAFTKVLQSRVAETLSENGLDAKKPEDWGKIFDRRKDEDMQFLMHLSEAFIKIHRPKEEIVKNLERASAS